MCDRSNRPARSRTARCSSRMPAYWTGICQPAKSISRAPRATWRSWSGVSWSVWSEVSVIVGPGSAPAHRRAGGRPDHRGRRPRRRARVDDLGRLGDQRPLGLEREQAGGLVERDPTNLVELVVVAGEVAADRLHQEVVDRLVDAAAALDEPVLDRLELVGDADLKTGLLGDLAEGGLLPRLARVRRALGEGPGEDVAVATAGTDDERGNSVVEANDDAAGRGGGGRPQPRHGAVAALERWVAPAGSEPVQRNETVGRRRPLAARRGWAARTARQSPRSWARMPSPGRCRTVSRVVAGWNEPAPRRPSRRSRARADGVTNRAVWRAAYRAAMLRSMGGNGSASIGRCKRGSER